MFSVITPEILDFKKRSVHAKVYFSFFDTIGALLVENNFLFEMNIS